jgi:hypothetical protein
MISGWPALYQTPLSETIARPSGLGKTDPTVTYSSTDVLSSELGIDAGKFELFHYSLEHAPSKGTVLEGIVDGDGIRLKMSW